MNPLNLLPWWAKLLILAAIASAVVGAVAAYNHWQREIGREEVRAEIREQAARDTEANTKETFRRIARQKENQDVQTAEMAQLRTAAAGAAAASERLQVRVNRLVAAARRAAANLTAGGERAPVDPGDPIGVLADVLGRADKVAGIMGAFAWESRLRGLQCERDYDALTGKP